MHRKEVSAHSPLRILEQSIRGGLGKGNLGVFIAPPGVGKSACLVQIGLDHLLREGAVLHVAIGQTVEHVSTWYDALFDELAELVHLADREEVRSGIGHRRLIRAFAEGAFTPARLHEAVAEFTTYVGLAPSAILVDGFDWTGPDGTTAIQALKATARRVGAELWMTARAAQEHELRDARSIPAPLDRCAELIDVGLVLEPLGEHVKLRLVKDFDAPGPSDVHLTLHARSLRLMKEGESAAPTTLPPHAFTLLATGSSGAEAEFGACAERWGLHEVNFTFSGRDAIARGRGLTVLSEEELQLGEVSPAYVKAHMHRSYPDSPAFKRVLQAIWHQVSRAGEVFSVGALMPDNTAHGGTGWAVELARHWGKPVHVFDQDKRRWFVWNGRDWAEEAPPTITRERFAGSGTRSLTPEGKAAIQGLFERSFGKPGQGAG